MKTFLKAQAASIAATVVDFLTTIICVEIFLLPVVMSGAVGNVVGAIANFFIGRIWVFERPEKKISVQAFRYAIVWFGYLILNATGMYLMEELTNVHYVNAKAVVGVVIGVTYNYFFQKKFVFN